MASFDPAHHPPADPQVRQLVDALFALRQALTETTLQLQDLIVVLDDRGRHQAARQVAELLAGLSRRDGADGGGPGGDGEPDRAARPPFVSRPWRPSP